MEEMTDGSWMLWFHRMELLSRIGLLGSIPELDNQLKGLNQIYSRGGAGLIGRFPNYYFNHWGAYTAYV